LTGPGFLRVIVAPGSVVVRFSKQVTMRGCAMRRGIGGVLLLLLLSSLFAALPAYAAASDWVLYDDFQSGVIDPAKWYGTEIGSTGREAERNAVSKKLNMLERSYGYTDSNTGSPSAEINLYSTQGADIKGMKATIKPVQFDTIGCENNTNSTWISARLWGRFFNTDETPVDGTNDVYAYIGIYRDSSKSSPDDNITRVRATVCQCQNAACDSKITLFTKEFRIIKKGKEVTLSMELDKDNHTFIFGFTSKTYKKIEKFTYDPITYPDKSSPYYKTKKLSVYSEVPNCTSKTRPVGFMNALFDNVFIKTY